jgi:plasmid stabilization system protein ParE
MYIAQDSVDAANRVEASFFAAFRRLAQSPMLGSTRPKITRQPVRFWTVPRFPRYTVIYRPDTSPLLVVTIVHGMRNLTAVLADPEIEY